MYLDDIVVSGSYFAEHLQMVQKVLSRIQNLEMKLKSDSLNEIFSKSKLLS